MPFLGKDWRSGGEKWIKTDDGWERIKVLETILDHISTELNKEKPQKLKKKNHLKNDNDEENDNYKDNEYDDDDDVDVDIEIDELKKIANDKNSSQQAIMKRQPYVHLNSIRHESSNRENCTPRLTVSEILNNLDMVGAVKDIRRFNYVCKFVQLIINEKLEELSGNAQRTLLMIVRCMLLQVITTNENLNIMKKLLIDFKKKIQNSYYYFYYIGSQKLCDKHVTKLTKWLNLLCNHELKMKKSPDSLSHFNHQQQNNFNNLPNDCKLEIIRRLNNGLDVVNISKCSKNLHDIISKEICVWKNLCLYHFQQEKINQLLKQKSSAGLVKKIDDSNIDELDWKTLYFRLKKRFGHKEVYVDMIHKCGYCKCLFWKEVGHPCAFSQEQESSMEPITPKKFINFLLS